jgi:hypothetical protein
MVKQKMNNITSDELNATKGRCTICGGDSAGGSRGCSCPGGPTWPYGGYQPTAEGPPPTNPPPKPARTGVRDV